MTTDPRPPVTVIGLGPMGQAMARALLAGGHPVTVWNRTPHGHPPSSPTGCDSRARRPRPWPPPTS